MLENLIPYRDLFDQIIKEAKNCKKEWVEPYEVDYNQNCIKVLDVLPEITDPQINVLLLVWRLKANIEHGHNTLSYDEGKDGRIRDVIRVPPAECFKNQNDLYSGILHELGHWTKNPNRSDRPGPFEPNPETIEYAKEEVIAELVCAFLGFYFKVYPTETHGTYLASIDKFQDLTKKDLEECFSHAVKATKYLLKKANFES